MAILLKMVFPLASLAFPAFAVGQTKQAANAQELADKLANPVANLISVPLQNNIDYGIGENNGSKYTINFQPVLPIQISSNLNLISRLILPIIDQRDVTANKSSQFGLSDASLTFFFSPIHVKKGLLLGLGPALLLPTGTNEMLSAKKWAAGPSLLIGQQGKGLTYGFLVNQVWSFAGDNSRSAVSQMFLQPFLTHSFKSGASVGANAEINSNWQAGNTSTMLNLTVGSVTKLGKQLTQITIGPRLPLGGPAETRPDWGIRAVLAFVFAK